MPDWIGTFQNRARHDCSKRGQHCVDTIREGFPQAVYTWGQVQGNKALMGGLMKGTSEGGQSVNGGGGLMTGNRPWRT